MTKHLLPALLLALLTAAAPIHAEEAAAPKGPLDFTLKNIDGEDTPLSKYAGKVVLMVNVASECGLTKQYKELQALHEQYGEQGLAVIGIPANNFGNQEPGTDAEIKEFCSSRFRVTFDMFSKISVKGDDIHPLFAWLTSEKTNKEFAGDIGWNFNKFLIGRNGQVIARFGPRTAPDDKDVIAAIEKALAEKV
jgi:glutathione peroxidase